MKIPVKSEWPTYIATSIVIAAPRAEVWKVLVNFAEYSKWNPFIREITLIDASKTPLPSGQLEVAAETSVALKVHMPPAAASPRALTERVLHVEPQRHFVWGAHNSPGWLFVAERWHILSDIQGGTKFEIIAVQRGAAPYLMKRMIQGPLSESLDAMAKALKERCERR